MDTLSFNWEKDQLGDLEKDDKGMIKKLRTLKCYAEMSGESVVLWSDSNQYDSQGQSIQGYRRMLMTENDTSAIEQEPLRQLSHDEYSVPKNKN